MFFGKMQSFYRRNSIHNQSSSQTSKSKEQSKRIKHVGKHKNDVDDDCPHNGTPIRRSSFSISRNGESAEECNRAEVPVIRIGVYEPETSRKSNILKEKEKALWYNTSPELDDNSERLGPNKNNIIEETLEIERRKSGDWGHQGPSGPRGPQKSPTSAHFS